jgi:hydroxyacyl-ACP dehydratase HTD2-like protein with hotdog domain
MLARRLTTAAQPPTALLNRTLPLLYDVLGPVPSHNLVETLSSFLPGAWLPAVPLAPAAAPAPPLPPAFHLLHFNPSPPPHTLLPDGTDPALSPGAPWTRRMWAGGVLRFPSQLPLDRRWAVCAERVVDVRLRPADPAGRRGELVFVALERRVGSVVEGESEIETRARLEAEGGGCAVIERRELVFMREAPATSPTAGDASPPAESNPLSERAPSPPLPEPTFRHALTPTPALLFRYSALTFNAHAIHLDAAHAVAREGHAGLLVHGPLTATLLATMAAWRAEPMGARLEELQYRNVAPLYGGEPLALCGREGARAGELKLWIEGPRGVAVRATAKLAGGD